MLWETKREAPAKTSCKTSGGISRNGATALCIFEAIVTAPLYCDILERILLPFIQEKFPPTNSYHFVQDNDLKHASRVAKEFFTSKSMNWSHTPPECPDMNPIENLWHELKEYNIRWDVKPTKTSLWMGFLNSGITSMPTSAANILIISRKFYPKSLRRMARLRDTDLKVLLNMYEIHTCRMYFVFVWLDIDALTCSC